MAARQNDGALAAVKVAKEVVPKIDAETAFLGSDESRGELALVLADIAEELGRQIPRHPKQALGQQAREVLGLMERAVPAELRPTARLSAIAAILTVAEDQVGRDIQLENAVVDIGDAVRNGDLPAAYACYDALLKEYPDLAGSEPLEKAMAAVSEAQRAKVRMVSRRQSPEAELAAPGVAATVVLTDRGPTQTGRAADAHGHVVVALAGGAALGVDAATGKVRWRRLIGPAPGESDLAFPPQPISTAPGSDVLLVDPGRKELWRVAGETGRVVWRFPLGEPIRSGPVVAGKHALVAAPSGRLVLVDLATGISPAYVQLPQPLDVAPAYDPARSLVYQVADHAHLYVLSLPDGCCRQVVHLGHRPGAVAVPPVLAGDVLVVAENQAAKGFYLRALRVADPKSKQPATMLQPVQRLALPGHVTSPMAARAGRRGHRGRRRNAVRGRSRRRQAGLAAEEDRRAVVVQRGDAPPFHRVARRSFLGCRHAVGLL